MVEFICWLWVRLGARKSTIWHELIEDRLLGVLGAIWKRILHVVHYAGETGKCTSRVEAVFGES